MFLGGNLDLEILPSTKSFCLPKDFLLFHANRLDYLVGKSLLEDGILDMIGLTRTHLSGVEASQMLL